MEMTSPIAVTTRLLFFFGILLIMAFWEWVAPKREISVAKVRPIAILDLVFHFGTSCLVPINHSRSSVILE